MDELENSWSFDDVALAHDVLDALEDAHARAEDQARRDAQKKTGR